VYVHTYPFDLTSDRSAQNATLPYSPMEGIEDKHNKMGTGVDLKRAKGLALYPKLEWWYASWVALSFAPNLGSGALSHFTRRQLGQLVT
jgi:hypothetical protein